MIPFYEIRAGDLIIRLTARNGYKNERWML